MYSSEYVTAKHPDKICDTIADAILDRLLKHDPNSRAAIEVSAGHSAISIIGEIRSSYEISDKELKEISETIAETKFSRTLFALERQSPEIARGVDTGGAGDQGIMVGYASRDNELMLPKEHMLAKSLAQFLYKEHPADAKTQVTINDRGEIVNLLASVADLKSSRIKSLVLDWLSDKDYTKDMELNINPAGDWSISGFDADSGMTGRKIVVDAYGPRVPVGGGAFSGKDASKVDRSGAIKARQVAVDILKSKESAKEVLVYLAYAIGKKEVLGATARVYTDNAVEEIDLKNRNPEEFYPQRIIEDLNLKKPIFESLAKWGPFGNGFEWDK